MFVTTDAQLLRFPARPSGPRAARPAASPGSASSPAQQVAFFGVVDPAREAIVVTAGGASDALPGTQPGAIKVTPYAEYPAKGRGTGGVRAHRFLKGEDTLVLAWVGPNTARRAAPAGWPSSCPRRPDAVTVPASRASASSPGSPVRPA